MKWISTIVFACCISLLMAQPDSTSKKRWFSFDVFIPDVAYSFQQIKQTTFPDQAKPLRLENKLHLIDFEILKMRLVFFDQLSFGAQVIYCSSSKKKDAQATYESSISDKHLTNWSTNKMYNLMPRLFIGYRYPYYKTEKKTRFVGCNIYLNFDRFNYGSYSYDAKNVNDNHFYHYNFQTTISNNRSVTFEIDHSTKYHLTKFRGNNPNTELLLGIRAGFTPRSQTVQFIETFQSLGNTTTNIPDPVRFKSWSLHLGIYLSLETTR